MSVGLCTFVSLLSLFPHPSLLSIYLCVCYMYDCEWRDQCVFPDSSLPYHFEAGSLTEPGTYQLLDNLASELQGSF